jgi:hypothetical protein
MWTKPIGKGRDSVALRQGLKCHCTWNVTEPPDDTEKRQTEQITTRKEKNTKEVRGKMNIIWLEGFACSSL